MSEGDEDSHIVLKHLQNTLECAEGCTEQRVHMYSPPDAPGDPDELGCSRCVSDHLSNIQRRPKNHGNECEAEMVAHHQGTAPGGAEGEEVRLDDVEHNQMHNSDAGGVHSTQGHPGDDGDKRYVETKVPGQVPGRGGRMEVQERSDNIRHDLERGIDGDSVGLDGKRGRMDGTMHCGT